MNTALKEIDQIAVRSARRTRSWNERVLRLDLDEQLMIAILFIAGVGAEDYWRSPWRGVLALATDNWLGKILATGWDLTMLLIVCLLVENLIATVAIMLDKRRSEPLLGESLTEQDHLAIGTWALALTLVVMTVLGNVVLCPAGFMHVWYEPFLLLPIVWAGFALREDDSGRRRRSKRHREEGSTSILDRILRIDPAQI